MPHPARAGSYARPVSQRRARVLVGLAAAAAAAVVVGVAVLQGGDAASPATPTTAEPPPPAARAGLLARSEERGRRPTARPSARRRGRPRGGRARFEEILAEDPDSVEAAVGAAIASWPEGTVDRLEALAAEQPVERRRAAPPRPRALWRAATRRTPRPQWRAAERVEPDSPAALRAEDLLHPQLPRAARPSSLPSQLPRSSRGSRRRSSSPCSTPAREERGHGRAPGLRHRPPACRACRSPHAGLRAGARGRPDSLAGKGGRRRSGASTRTTRRRRSPASGRCADADENGVVRYHLGLALSWIGQVEEAIRQLELARDADPGGFYGREAGRLLDRLEDVGLRKVPQKGHAGRPTAVQESRRVRANLRRSDR